MSGTTVSRDAPKTTLKQFIEAKCEPRRPKGPFKMDAYKSANTHDGVLDTLSKEHPSLRRALSEIAGSFWVWNPMAQFSLAKSARALMCLRDETNGAANTCFKGTLTVGQLPLISAVAIDKNNKPTVLRYMEAFFTIAGKDKLDLFGKRELQVARGDEALLKEIKALASITDVAKLEEAVSGANRKDGLSMSDRGVSASAATQLAASAFHMVDQLAASGVDCKSKTVQELYAKGNLWLKIARRLAHGGDAARWVDSQKTQNKFTDPLFVARAEGEGDYSSFVCEDKAVQSAITYLNVQGSHGEISAASITFLVGAMTAADAVMKKCVKKVWVPNPKRTPKQEKCKGGKVPDGNLGCKCPPEKPKWSKRHKRCYKPTVYRPMRPTPMRPVMRPTPMSSNMAAEGGFTL